MSRQDKTVRAAQAQQLLDNPLLQEALTQIEDQLVSRIKKTEFDGSEQNERYREKLNLALYVQGKFKSYLQQVVNTGKLKQAELDRKSTLNRKGL